MESKKVSSWLNWKGMDLFNLCAMSIKFLPCSSHLNGYGTINTGKLCESWSFTLRIYAHCTYTHCTYRQIVLGGPRAVGSTSVFTVTQGYFFCHAKASAKPLWPIGPFQSMCFKPGHTEKELLVSVVACFKFEFGNWNKQTWLMIAWSQ